MNQREKEAEERNRTIVTFTNIDSESFTHSYGGFSTTVPAGGTKPMRLPEALHLAKHLARKMLAREAKKKRPSGDPTGTLLWTNEQVEELKDRIIAHVEQEERPMNAEEAHWADQKRLEEKYAAQNPPPAQQPPEVSKKDVIEELNRRGIEADMRRSKEDLLALLIASEQKIQ